MSATATVSVNPLYTAFRTCSMPHCKRKFVPVDALDDKTVCGSCNRAAKQATLARQKPANDNARQKTQVFKKREDPAVSLMEASAAVEVPWLHLAKRLFAVHRRTGERKLTFRIDEVTVIVSRRSTEAEPRCLVLVSNKLAGNVEAQGKALRKASDEGWGDVLNMHCFPLPQGVECKRSYRGSSLLIGPGNTIRLYGSVDGVFLKHIKRLET